MIDLDEARSLVCQHTRPLAPVRVPLENALGLVLAEDITSSIDSPPHDKSMVDGFALQSDDLQHAETELLVLEQVTAGEVPTQQVRSGTATLIMTGAPIPDGADAVVMLEQTETHQGAEGTTRVRIRETDVRAGQNIMVRGQAIRRGDPLLSGGSTIRAIEVGLLAETGLAAVPAIPRPTVAVLATGDELVPAHRDLSPGQIRNSNGPMLRALVQRTGGEVTDLGIARDDSDELAQLITRGLASDILVLSGGVSAGVLDLVPKVLQRLGVQEVFHKVRLKPGKPVWFGVQPGDAGDKLVFGLPGNPVSTLVCFELFVHLAMNRLGGHLASHLQLKPAVLVGGYQYQSDRPTFYPARLIEQMDEAMVEPLAWQGSADLRALALANCLLWLPAGESVFAAGDRVSVYVL